MLQVSNILGEFMFKIKEIPTPGTNVNKDQFAEILCRSLLSVNQSIGDNYTQILCNYVDDSIDYLEIGDLGVRKLNFEYMTLLLFQSSMVLNRSKLADDIIFLYLDKFKNMMKLMDDGANISNIVLYDNFKDEIIKRLGEYSSIVINIDINSSDIECLSKLCEKFIYNMSDRSIYNESKHLELFIFLMAQVSDISYGCISDYPIKKGILHF